LLFEFFSKIESYVNDSFSGVFSEIKLLSIFGTTYGLGDISRFDKEFYMVL